MLTIRKNLNKLLNFHFKKSKIEDKINQGKQEEENNYESKTK